MRLITAVLLILISSTGCRFSVARVRSGTPLRYREFESLETGKATLQQSLDVLGAPDDVAWETDQSRLTWEYIDVTHFQTRLQLPLAFLGYRHNLFNYFEDHDVAHAMDLVFDEAGTLREKTLRLPETHRREPEPENGTRIQLTPRAEHAFLLIGDGGVADYDDLFQLGWGAGLDLSIQPVAPVTLSVGGRYHEFPGRDLTVGASRLRVDDLDLYTGEAGLRIQIPLRVFSSAESFGKIWQLFLDKDPATHDGFVLFIEGTAGFTINEDVLVARNGRFAGTLYDRGIELTSSGSTGLEYSAEHVSVRLGIIYRAGGDFDRGSASFTSEGGSFQTLGGFAALAIKF